MMKMRMEIKIRRTTGQINEEELIKDVFIFLISPYE